jgi:YD repeat-containing protein
MKLNKSLYFFFFACATLSYPHICMAGTRYAATANWFPTPDEACSDWCLYYGYPTTTFPDCGLRYSGTPPNTYPQCYVYRDTGNLHNYRTVTIETGDCVTFFGDGWLDNNGQCVSPKHKQPTDPCGAGNPSVGQPIIVLSGNKHQEEVDYQSTKPLGLSFVRVFNSSAASEDNGIGIKWRHDYAKTIEVSGSTAFAHRSNGQVFTFAGNAGVWTGDVDIPDTLVETVDGQGVRTGWLYTNTNDVVEAYDVTGRLISITNRQGQVQSFNHDLTLAEGGDDNSATLDSVIGPYGEVMMFSYDASGRISTMTDIHGRSYQYSYDALGNLSTVIYPEDVGTSTRLYHYEDVNFPNNLTGITDEKGNRYATWTYDAQGRAVSSALAGGVDNVTLDYSVPNNVTVTNPLGKQTTYEFTTLHGVKKLTQITGHQTANCAGANQAYTYDANGYIQSKTDWKGNVTTYIHDARGLETSRTEADGTTEARTITTEWHSSFRLPTKITEPGKVTEFTYDAQGKLLSTTVTDLP